MLFITIYDTDKNDTYTETIHNIELEIDQSKLDKFEERDQNDVQR
jgi:hypothetical protein